MAGEERRNRIEAKLVSGLETTHIEVVDESHLHAGHAGAQSGAGHFRAVIVSERFEGLSRIKAQQLVFATLGDEMGEEIHAFSMKTFTPDAWRATQAGSGS
jgi:BolA protein